MPCSSMLAFAEPYLCHLHAKAQGLLCSNSSLPLRSTRPRKLEQHNPVTCSLPMQQALVITIQCIKSTWSPFFCCSFSCCCCSWVVPGSAGPAAGGPSSKLWMYRSTVDMVGNAIAGLAGPLVIAPPGGLAADGRKAADVDKEFFMFMQVGLGLRMQALELRCRMFLYLVSNTSTARFCLPR